MTEHIEEIMNQLPAMRPQHGLSKGFSPALDIYETDNDVVVESMLAGVHPEDVKVSIEHGMITIQGETSREREIDEKNYYRKEVRSGSFFRQVPLPVPVLDEDISAEFEDGLLKITCPKAEEKKGKKVEIAIKRGKQSKK